MQTFLDFEKQVAELEGKITELRHMSDRDGMNIVEEVTRLQNKANKILSQLYTKLTPWQTVQVARHSERPHTKHYIEGMIDDFTPLAGDRLFGEDEAIIGGMGRFKGQSVVVMGHEKGHDTETRLRHNFGMPNPEGYRKAQRLMQLADQYGLPVITLVDTSGAYPGLEAEERGQAEAIARSIKVCLDIKVPLITTIIGEGGSGGAIAIATANKVVMLEHAIYSVISPEGCASILYRNADKKEDAATGQKITAKDLAGLGVIDAIVKEPLGGAHRDHAATISSLSKEIEAQMKPLLTMTPQAVRDHRREKFLAMGQNQLK